MKMNIINIISLFLILVLTYWITKTISENFECNIRKKTIPKKIWGFWDNGELPPIVKICIESWRKYNPDHEIIILTNTNIKDYLPDVDFSKIKFIEKPQRRSDFIRLFLLEKYGGFWIDASTLMTGSLDKIHKIQQRRDGIEFVGYYLDSYTNKCEYPIIENWCLAAVKDSKFIKLWLAAFMKLNNFDTIEDYLKHIHENGVDLQKLGSPDYLTMHVACQEVLQKHMTLEDIKRTIVALRAEDGPFKYLVQNDWDAKRGLQSLCKGENITQLIKIRTIERDIIGEDNSLMCAFTRNT